MIDYIITKIIHLFLLVLLIVLSPILIAIILLDEIEYRKNL